MKPALALVVLVALSACKRSSQAGAVPVPTQEVVAGVELIDFVSDEAKFSCRVPGEWGVESEKFIARSKGLMLSGPQATHISISKYPDLDPQYSDARAYAESIGMIVPGGKQPEITHDKLGDREIFRFHYERMPYPKRTRNSDRPERLDVALITVKGGFYEIQHSASVDTYQKTLPVFEAVVRSFQPKS
jgi:hypothetical protein